MFDQMSPQQQKLAQKMAEVDKAKQKEQQNLSFNMWKHVNPGYVNSTFTTTNKVCVCGHEALHPRHGKGRFVIRLACQRSVSAHAKPPGDLPRSEPLKECRQPGLIASANCRLPICVLVYFGAHTEYMGGGGGFSPGDHFAVKKGGEIFPWRNFGIRGAPRAVRNGGCVPPPVATGPRVLNSAPPNAVLNGSCPLL